MPQEMIHDFTERNPSIKAGICEPMRIKDILTKVDGQALGRCTMTPFLLLNFPLIRQIFKDFSLVAPSKLQKNAKDPKK